MSCDEENYPSICKIKENMNPELSFNFSETGETGEHKVGKIIDKLQVKMAIGVDKTSCKIHKLAKTALQSPLTGLINLSVQTSTFPDSIKRAQVTPPLKKNDTMDKTNFRPVCILTVTSKFYEKILSLQLSAYFENIFDKYLCAFRKRQGCQTVLLRLLGDWRAVLDNNEYVAVVLMDLSRAFDCLPHKILLIKLSAYGLSDEAVILLKSYLSDLKQRIKLNNIASSWSEIKKGVLQGSILGQLLFNVFINDIFTL